MGMYLKHTGHVSSTHAVLNGTVLGTYLVCTGMHLIWYVTGIYRYLPHGGIYIVDICNVSGTYLTYTVQVMYLIHDGTFHTVVSQ